MRTHQPEGQLLLFEELNEERTGHVEKIGRLLGGELGVLRHDRDRAARCHVLQNCLEKHHGARWQFDRLVLTGIADTQT